MQSVEQTKHYLKEKVNTGAVKFELSVTYCKFKTTTGETASVYHQGVITGYYDKYGKKFTQ